MATPLQPAALRAARRLQRRGRRSTRHVLSEQVDSDEHKRLSTEAVVRRHHRSVLRFLRRRGATADDALDIAQEAYVRLLKYEGATDIESPTAMLFRIAGNVAADHVRAAAHQRRIRSFEGYAYDAEIASDEPSAERELAAEQVVTALRNAIAALSPQCRTVFLLSRIDGLTYTEIASKRGISVKTVEKHVSRALRVCTELSA
jgi:RNA polymerase sigma-70 factor (ECF subfamily)